MKRVRGSAGVRRDRRGMASHSLLAVTASSTQALLTRADSSPCSTANRSKGGTAIRRLFVCRTSAIVGGITERTHVPRNEFLCTKKEYGDFELRLKFKVLGEGCQCGSADSQSADSRTTTK